MAYLCDNIHLEKGMYSEAGNSFSQVLERCDPSENYKGTALEGLDAFQRQLKRFDIKVRGPGSDPVEKFFASAESAVLFPEYISRAVRQGMEETNILPDITATVTDFDGMDYRSISSVPEDEKKLRRVEPGTKIPATTIKLQENLVRLHKRGRVLVASYETVRRRNLDLFSVTLRQIGAHINRMQLEDAIDVILNGDGNANPAGIKSVSSLDYNALVDFWNTFDPYRMNTLLAGADTAAVLLKLSQMQDANAGLNFHGTGSMITPLGAKLLKTSAMSQNTLIGLDKNYALEMVQSGGVCVEYDKLIDRQLERAAITVTSGFAKIFPDAVKVLKITPSSN